MIARHSQIRQQVQEMSSLLARPGHIQKIYSTARYLCLQVRVERKNVCLYLGRGGGFEGLWLSSSIPSSFLRKRDRWLEWCRSHLSSALLLDVTMDPLDRSICLRLQKAGARQDFYVSWIGRDSYFAFNDGLTGSCFTSWQGDADITNDFSMFDTLGRKDMSANSQNSSLTPIEELLKLEEAAALKGAQPKKKIKSLETKLMKIENDLRIIRQWADLQSWLARAAIDEIAKSPRLQIGELTYKWPKNLNDWQKRDWAFGQVKRLKEAEVLQSSRLETFRQELSQLLVGKAPALENNLRPIGPVWKSTQVTAPFVAPEEGDFAIHNFDFGRIAVGRSAKGNDQMRKSWARDEDWWMHTSSGTSAHAILKLTKGGMPTPEMIVSGARLIAIQSRITATQIELIITQVKNVRGVTGSPGMVTYKKQKMLLCDLSGSD